MRQRLHVSVQESIYATEKQMFTPYLLHGDLWLGGHVLLGVAHSGSVLVLGHGSYWSSGSGGSTGSTLTQRLCG